MIKILYYASYILWLPFVILNAVLYIITGVIDWIADTIHDNVTVNIWKVINKRKIKEL